MSEYIKREDAINRIKTWMSFDELDKRGLLDGISTALTAIDSMPSANVVEVVRCKDCKYSQFKDNGVLRPTAYCHRLNVIISGKGKGYCYLGERKDGKEGE